VPTKVRTHNAIPLLSESGSFSPARNTMWVVFKVYFPSVQRQNTDFKSDFVLGLSVTVFPQHGQLFSKDLLKPSSLWMLRSPKARVRGKLSGRCLKGCRFQCFFLSSQWMHFPWGLCLCKQGQRYGQFMRERRHRKKPIKIS